jgi:putative tryptophan/tyrosine transport system substrate-binding protein
MRRRTFIALLGGAAAWPLAARAQQPAMPVIGFMSVRSAEDSVDLLAAFHTGLREAGFVEGQNIAVQYRWAGGQYDQMPAMAADLVNRRVAVIAALGGDPSAIAAKRATATIPIVFGIGGDPIKAGLVESFNHPGGNATGYTLLNNLMESKRIGLLHDLVPGAGMIGALVNPSSSLSGRQLQEIEDATRRINLKVFVARASNDTELDAALASLVRQRVGALLVGGDPYFSQRRDRIIAFVAEHRLPAIYQWRDFAAAGGLISYGPRFAEFYRQAGLYVSRILRGAKPADLPVLQTTRFELAINMKTAHALGLAVPSSMQLLADEVIE